MKCVSSVWNHDWLSAHNRLLASNPTNSIQLGNIMCKWNHKTVFPIPIFQFSTHSLYTTKLYFSNTHSNSNYHYSCLIAHFSHHLFCDDDHFFYLLHGLLAYKVSRWSGYVDYNKLFNLTWTKTASSQSLSPTFACHVNIPTHILFG